MNPTSSGNGTSDAVKENKSQERTKKGRKITEIMVRAGVSENCIPANIIADVVQTMITPIATYAISNTIS